jgi:hypothetical protein
MSENCLFERGHVMKFTQLNSTNIEPLSSTTPPPPEMDDAGDDGCNSQSHQQPQKEEEGKGCQNR